MKRIHFIGIILIISLYSILITNEQSNAQYIDYTFSHISTTEGLSNFTVLDITQDKQGFMWFGTMDGLNRFDGEQIKVYREDPEDSFSLGSSYIRSLLCTSDSNMWVGTNRGLYMYDFFHDHFHFVNARNSDGDPILISIRSLSQQNDILWIGTETGFFKYDLKNERFIAFDGKTEYQKQIGNVNCFLASESDELWVGSDQGLFKQSGKDLISIQLPEYTDRNLIVRSITKDSKGNIWLGTDNRDVGLIIYNPETQKTLELSFKNGKLPNNQIRSLFRSQNGEIWVGTRDGLAILDEVTLDSKFLLHDRLERFSLSQNSIRPIYQSSEGIIWIGTYSGGVNYFDPRT
ncbi:MAG: hypothetical protein KAK04_24165, partial [Cyclobacteriaceae bacterium]|nr:hypothetical protein [Cyclobacteriaceae bacterium]